MNNAYIVVKNSKPFMVDNFKMSFSTNEAVFSKEIDAQKYIKERKALKDRDDRGCTFTIQPWIIR